MQSGNNYICKCGVEIVPANMHNKSTCKNCYNAYMRKYTRKNYFDMLEYHKEYMRDRRWLDGGPDNHLVGEDIQLTLRSVNGVLKI